MSSLAAIQTAIYSRLNGDATLLSLVSGVFNDVPEEQAFPHVQIGTPTERKWHRSGFSVTVTVHVWSRYQGDSEALAIVDRVTDLLDLYALPVAPYTTVICEYEQGRVLIETVDKIETRHAPIVFRILVHP